MAGGATNTFDEAAHPNMGSAHPNMASEALFQNLHQCIAAECGKGPGRAHTHVVSFMAALW